MKNLKKLLILLLVFASILLSDNKSIVIQSASTVIEVLEGKSFVRHMTPFIIDIARNGHLLPDEIKTKLKLLGFDFSGNLVVMIRPNLDYYYDTVHFRIHYDLTGTNAVDNTITNENNIPDYINTMAIIFEEVYDHEINELGYTPPPNDGGAGGSDAYDIYVKSTNAYGWTDRDYPAISEKSYSSYITMRNNYKSYQFLHNTELENIQITAGHEFFHAIQLGYDGDAEIWLMEATAVWMEEETYDDVNDCYQYMIPWFVKPHMSLNQSYGLHQYGSYIFFKYIVEHLGGPEIIKNTWEQSRLFDSSGDIDYSIQSVDLALKGHNHSFKKALNNMSIANAIFSAEDAAGQYAYEEAIGYHNYREYSYNDTLSIQLGIYDSLNFIKGIPANIESNNLQLYGSQYIKINATDPVKISINTHDLTLHTVVKSNSGNYEVQSGSVLNIDPGSNTDWIYAVVVASGDEGSDYNYDLSFTDGVSKQNNQFIIGVINSDEDPYPNPFNSIINFKIQVFNSSNIKVSITDILGREVKRLSSGTLEQGIYDYQWNGKTQSDEKVSSGIYFITAVSDNRQEWKKITLIK